MSRDTYFFTNKREKVCLAILERLIDTMISQEPGQLLTDIHCGQLVTKAVNMTDQMLLELKVRGEQIPKEVR